MRRKWGESEVTSIEDKRKLVIRRFPMKSIAFGADYALEQGMVKVAENIADKVERDESRIKKVTVTILPPGKRDMFVNAILDFFPIVTKADESRPGQGLTNELTGMKVLLTGAEEGGFQPSNIGSSQGILGEHAAFGMPGTPEETDWLLHVDCILAEGEGRTREGIMAAHEVCDRIMQPLRTFLKDIPVTESESSSTYFDTRRNGGRRVVLVKLIPGLGNMYDTMLFPKEPCGYLGALSIMDLSNNKQIVMTPNEYRDGMVHSLT
jgi:hypothetical protein